MQVAIVKLLEQGPLKQNNWTNSQGQGVVISSVELKFTDGINTFYAEVSDQQAININQNKLVIGGTYSIQYLITCRKWENQNHEEMHANSFRITRINQF